MRGWNLTVAERRSAVLAAVAVVAGHLRERKAPVTLGAGRVPRRSPRRSGWWMHSASNNAEPPTKPIPTISGASNTPGLAEPGAEDVA